MTVYKLPLTAATCLTWWWIVSRSLLTEKLIHPDPENDLINPHLLHSPLPPPLLSLSRSLSVLALSHWLLKQTHPSLFKQKQAQQPPFGHRVHFISNKNTRRENVIGIIMIKKKKGSALICFTSNYGVSYAHMLLQKPWIDWFEG